MRKTTWGSWKAHIGLRIADTRVSLDSLIYLFREGVSAEGVVESYPALTLEQVRGALAFYLGTKSRSTPTSWKGSAPGVATPAVETNECRIDCQASVVSAK